MPPRIRKITKPKPSSIVEIDDDTEDLVEATKDLEFVEFQRIPQPEKLQDKIDAILEKTQGVTVAPEAISTHETLPAKIKKERKKKAETKDAVVDIRPATPSNEDGEVWAEISYAIDAQRKYTLGAKRKLRDGESLVDAHAQLCKQVLNSILTLV